MRPLYWTRIQMKTAPLDKNCLWNDVEETNFNCEELEDLFCNQQKVQKKLDEKPQKSKRRTKEVTKLLDQKRSQNLGILISSLHLDISELQNALKTFDTSTISTDKLQSVYESKPTDEELKLLKDHIQSKKSPPLDKPEQFLWDLSQIPEYAIRIECIMFHSSFSENIEAIESRLLNLRHICENLKGKSVQNIISIVLSIGNYMNGGNPSRGQADGFGIEILTKLRDVKSKDNSLTLLHFVVKSYVSIFEKDSSAESRQLPVPEPSDVEKAGNVSFEEVKKELDKLYNQASACKRKVEKILKSTDEEQPQVKEKMESFLEKAFADVKAQMLELDASKELFTGLLQFFKYQPKSNKENEWPKEFFSIWQIFASDFKDIYKKQQQLAEENRRKMEKKLNEVKTKNNGKKSSLKSNSLKSRLRANQAKQ